MTNWKRKNRTNCQLLLYGQRRCSRRIIARLFFLIKTIYERFSLSLDFRSLFFFFSYTQFSNYDVRSFVRQKVNIFLEICSRRNSLLSNTFSDFKSNSDRLVGPKHVYICYIFFFLPFYRLYDLIRCWQIISLCNYYGPIKIDRTDFLVWKIRSRTQGLGATTG